MIACIAILTSNQPHNTTSGYINSLFVNLTNHLLIIVSIAIHLQSRPKVVCCVAQENRACLHSMSILTQRAKYNFTTKHMQSMHVFLFKGAVQILMVQKLLTFLCTTIPDMNRKVRINNIMIPSKEILVLPNNRLNNSDAWIL